MKLADDSERYVTRADICNALAGALVSLKVGIGAGLSPEANLAGALAAMRTELSVPGTPTPPKVAAQALGAAVEAATEVEDAKTVAREAEITRVAEKSPVGARMMRNAGTSINPQAPTASHRDVWQAAAELWPDEDMRRTRLRETCKTKFGCESADLTPEQLGELLDAFKVLATT